MSEQTALRNEYDLYLYQSPGISSGIVSQYPDRPLSPHHPHDHRTPHAYTWPEIPNDISIPLCYDSYVYSRSHKHFTPQAAGNTTPKRSIYAWDFAHTVISTCSELGANIESSSTGSR